MCVCDTKSAGLSSTFVFFLNLKTIIFVSVVSLLTFTIISQTEKGSFKKIKMETHDRLHNETVNKTLLCIK